MLGGGEGSGGKKRSTCWVERSCGALGTGRPTHGRGYFGGLGVDVRGERISG